ncbi:hypothetical protein M758_2G047500 [Ceratodon purpureus]|nr:hypothetical protein M758_2G047500 [Ceratodon purpureus]
MGNDGHGQLPSQPVAAAIGELDDLLSKLSTWDGSSGTTHDDPTSPTVTGEMHRVDENGKTVSSSGETGYLGVPEENHLEMKEIEPHDIDVILRLSGADSSSFPDVRNGGSGEVLNDVQAERIKVATDVSSISNLDNTGEASVGDEIVESSHVWYGCYGSNVWKKRFMCYIEGGTVEGMTRWCIGCRDKSPPVASDWISIPNRLFFGHESTRTWGLGGVAFLNPISEPGVVSHIRIYKITMEQFNDVLSQENPGRVQRNWMSGKQIHELKKREPHYLMDIFGEESWYGTVKYLGEKDGLPILTFTCPESHMEKFRSGEFGTFGPPDAYRNVIVKGLIDLGHTEEEGHEYVSAAILPKDSKDHKGESQESLTNHYY